MDTHDLESLVRRLIREVLTGNSPALTVNQASAILQVAPPTTRRWIREGRLKAHHAGRHLRILRASIDEFLASGGKDVEGAKEWAEKTLGEGAK